MCVMCDLAQALEIREMIDHSLLTYNLAKRVMTLPEAERLGNVRAMLENNPKAGMTPQMLLARCKLIAEQEGPIAFDTDGHLLAVDFFGPSDDAIWCAIKMRPAIRVKMMALYGKRSFKMQDAAQPTQDAMRNAFEKAVPGSQTRH